MKVINQYEEAIANKVKDLKAVGINRTMFWAYRDSKRAGSEDLNFDDVIWDEDIDYIVENCRANGIERITISSSFSGLPKVLWLLTQKGCTIEGMTQTPSRYTRCDWNTDKEVRDQLPALVIKIN